MLVVAALDRHGDDGSVDDAPTVSPSSAPAVSGSVVGTLEPVISVDQLAGRRWVATEQVGAPWRLAYVPYLEFGSSGLPDAIDPLFGGNDGCNWYGAHGSLDGGLLVVDEVQSTAMDCGPGTGGVAPQDGDRLALASDGSALTLHDANGLLRLVYAPLDAFAPADAKAVAGRWRLDPGSATWIEFDDGGGGGVIGRCTVSWSLASELTVTGWPSDPYACASQQDQTASRLIEMLVGGPASAAVGPDDALYLSDTQFVLRLSRLSDPASTVATAPASPPTTSPLSS